MANRQRKPVGTARRHSAARVIGARARIAGQTFENMVESACERYEALGVAKIKKTPEPMKPLGPKNAKGQFLACYTKAAQPDYGGTLKGGRSVYFEAKHTDSDRIEWRRLTEEQRDDLEEHGKLGAAVFVLVSFGLAGYYRVPWNVWRDMAKIYGRQYLKPSELEEYAVPIVGGYLDFLRGLGSGGEAAP